MPDDQDAYYTTLLEVARLEREQEDTRLQSATRTIRWWSAGCLAVTTLHGALPFGLLAGLDSRVVRGVAVCVVVSLCGWAWAVWGSVRRLKPRSAAGRSGILRRDYLQGKTVDERRVFHELWGYRNSSDSGGGSVAFKEEEANEADRFAEDVYRMVRRACLVTGAAAATSLVIVMLGLLI